jgi:hypothetical protein
MIQEELQLTAHPVGKQTRKITKHRKLLPSWWQLFYLGNIAWYAPDPAKNTRANFLARVFSTFYRL